MTVKLQCTDCLNDVETITSILTLNNVDIKRTRSSGIIKKIITVVLPDSADEFLNKLIAYINSNSKYGVIVLSKKKSSFWRL